jgi:hypothetical protein
MDNNLSSADLLTLQVLERELTDPNISKDYEREIRARIEYLRTVRPEMIYTYKDIEAHRTLLSVKAHSNAEADKIFKKKFGHNPWETNNIHMIPEQS